MAAPLNLVTYNFYTSTPKFPSVQTAASNSSVNFILDASPRAAFEIQYYLRNPNGCSDSTVDISLIRVRLWERASFRQRLHVFNLAITLINVKTGIEALAAEKKNLIFETDEDYHHRHDLKSQWPPITASTTCNILFEGRGSIIRISVTMAVRNIQDGDYLLLEHDLPDDPRTILVHFSKSLSRDHLKQGKLR